MLHSTSAAIQGQQSLTTKPDRSGQTRINAINLPVPILLNKLHLLCFIKRCATIWLHQRHLDRCTRLAALRLKATDLVALNGANQFKSRLERGIREATLIAT